MKSLLWKELRENARWALLAMLAFGAALAYGLYHSAHGNDFSFYEGVTVLKKTFLMATTFGAPAVALLLAFLQVIPELKADRWAALLHRPIPATTVFWAKALSGSFLYLLAVGLPYAVLVALVATPGYFPAPFFPAMLLPSLVDLLAGLMYYYAALAIALQRGRFFLLLPFPLLAAYHVSLFVIGAKEVRPVLEAVLVMAAALLIAAWGVMQCRDRFSPRPWLSRLAFLAVTFYGVCGLGDLALMLFGPLLPKPASISHSWELTKDGPPVHLVYKNSTLTEVFLPDGNPPTDPKYKPNRVTSSLDYGNTLSQYIGDTHGWKPSPWIRSYRESSTYLYADATLQFPRFEIWFYLYAQRYYVSYLPMLKEPVDRLDAGGFHPLDTPIASFPPGFQTTQAGEATRAFAVGDKLTYAFLERRQILDVPLPAPGPIYGVEASWAYANNKAVYIVAVALPSGIAIYDENAAFLSLLPYRHDVDRWGQLTVSVNKTRDRFQVYYEPSVWIDRKTRATMPSYVDSVDLQGNVLASYTLAPLPKRVSGTSLATLLTRRTHSLAFFFGETAYQNIGALCGSTRLANAERDRWAKNLPATQEYLLWGASISLVLALVTFFWTRHAGFTTRQSWLWSLFVFALGLPGFLTFRLTVDWPVRVACPSCHRRRSIAESTCPSCASPWPAPARDGLEIIDRPLTASL